MKKVVAVLIIFSSLSAVWAADVRDELIGEWSARAMLVEMEDGRILETEAAYAFPYLGITVIDFLDGGFVVFTSGKAEYRAFYEVEELDFDNYHVRCMFKNGEELVLKLVRSGDEWKYLYRLPETSILKGMEVDEEASENEEPEEPEGPEDEIGSEEDSEPLYSFYVGTLIKKEMR